MSTFTFQKTETSVHSVGVNITVFGREILFYQLCGALGKPVTWPKNYSVVLLLKQKAAPFLNPKQFTLSKYSK